MFQFFHVPRCSGMFRNVPECSGMFHVPGFIDAQTNFRFHRQKVSFPKLACGDFQAHLLASPALISI